ncbi:hypothetical protein CDL12_23959 [Handroanthus impetiginosus]|uniref:PB1 domain-containing protein n=1 Tax=Handroanthus impetiginosus TaxID=429701 RepID=A0A2G9GES4_9LAMI|nr:hypothetical protein CDL12_23959 [Handroanthus impetiginosus]
MEAPPPPPPLSAAPPVATSGPTAAVYADSIDSSPRSRHTDSWDTDAPPPQPPQKLRLMCSYGGHIVPRPHDKTLCYIGGDTRIIVIDRHTSLSDLHHRLSKTLLHNESFALKYQLPNEDLDSLISVTTDEDLENMVEEYDRLNNAGVGSKPGRLRLFLFPKSSSNIEQLLVETASTKSEDWFFNALNGKASTLSTAASDHGFSESSSVNNLLGLDDESVGKASGVRKDVEAQIEGSKSGGNGNSGTNQDVHSVPDSPMLETSSSFGSTSSSPSMANLPPIKVHVEENPKVGGLGIEDQFQQMTLGVAGNVNLAPPQKQEEVGGFVAPVIAAGTVVPGVPVVVGGEYPNRVISEDERSDHAGYRNVQQIQPQVQVQLQQQQIHQLQQKQTGAIDLASPDSVSSEGSVTNPSSRQRQAMYQESIMHFQSGNTRVITSQADPKTGDQTNTKVHMQPQVQESGYVISGQYDQNHPQLHQQQQFVHAGNQYIAGGAVPIPSYYPIYPSQQQHHPHQHVLDQQYPFYFVPARQTQAYNLPVHQTSYSEMAPTAAPSSRPHTPPSTAIASHPAYNQPINAPSSKPEVATGVYRTAAGAAPQLVQVPSGQHQGQYVGYTQIHHPAQSITPSSAPTSAYTYELADPAHAQMYYTQALPPQLAAQYQTMTSAPGMVLPDASAQLPTENIKQQVRTLQP